MGHQSSHTGTDIESETVIWRGQASIDSSSSDQSRNFLLARHRCL